MHAKKYKILYWLTVPLCSNNIASNIKQKTIGTPEFDYSTMVIYYFNLSEIKFKK